MRVRHLLAGFAVTASTVGLIGAGCGGSTDAGPTDAGSDVVSDKTVVVQDTGPDVGEPDTAVECVDADLNTINPADAEIGDSSASVGTCLACARTSCMSEISACNLDCSCKDGVITFATCVQTGSVIGCAMGLAGSNEGQALGLCLYSNCRPQCGQGNLILDAGDGG